jgi:putative phosphoribosyl transferase
VGKMGFRNRVDAGRRLAAELADLRGTGVVVLGLARGGVPVAAQVARALSAPLDVIVVRKVGVPWQPEVEMGAVAEDGVWIVDREVVEEAGVEPEELFHAQHRARDELALRVAALRRGRPRVPLAGRTAVIVDDGMATGSTARAACQVARVRGAARVVLAVPVAAAEAVDHLSKEADEVVCPWRPDWFGSVGCWYDDFRPATEDEVLALLDTAPADPSPVEHVTVPAAGVLLPGQLAVPRSARAVVAFAHGTGSRRHAARNRYLAGVLHRAGLATLLVDLVRAEDADGGTLFDIELLGRRLHDLVSWLGRHPAVAGLPIGLFGAGTGAAAALCVAAEPDATVAAVVCYGGRPDLAGTRLDGVRVPTLLIVGGRELVLGTRNRIALAQLRCRKRMVTIPGATQLFDEPGTLDRAAGLAADWFAEHLRATTRRRQPVSGRPKS